MYFFSFFFSFLFFLLFMVVSVAYGSSQARGRIGAAAADLHHSHSKTGSEPHLQPTSQLMATLDLQSSEQGQGSNPSSHGY